MYSFICLQYSFVNHVRFCLANLYSFSFISKKSSLRRRIFSFYQSFNNTFFANDFPRFMKIIVGFEKSSIFKLLITLIFFDEAIKIKLMKMISKSKIFFYKPLEVCVNTGVQSIMYFFISLNISKKIAKK